MDNPFLAQGQEVIWITEGGPCRLTCGQIDTLLGIFESGGAIKPWLDLDKAAREAGYPASVTSMRGAA